MLSGWKRRWFVIQSPTYQSPDAVFRYYETPTAPEPKGAVVLNRSATLAICKKGKHANCFCITSQGKSDSKPICTILAVDAQEELPRWMRSLQDAINSSGGVVGEDASVIARGFKPQWYAAGVHGGMVNKRDAANLEQLADLDEDQLQGLRVKKLKQLAAYLAVNVYDVAEPEEKKEGYKHMWISLDEDTMRFKKEVARRIYTARHLHQGAAAEGAKTRFDDLHDALQQATHNATKGGRFAQVVKDANATKEFPAEDFARRVKGHQQ